MTLTPTTIRPQPLYRRILGDAWEQLSPQVRQLHSVAGESRFAGECTVYRGRNPLAWLIATLIGFPDAGASREISVGLIEEGDGERWIREVGNRRFTSIQHPGGRRHRGLIRERFGPVAVYLALLVDDGRLRYLIRGWTFCGIPLPLAIGPRTTAVESAHGDRFRFDVEISHVLTGLIVHYRGTLSPIRRQQTEPRRFAEASNQS
jgi:hypothetical protein